MKTNAYIVAGPTASGKSDFAHKLALCAGGVVINCDSVQMYRGIENISANPFAKYSPPAEGCPRSGRGGFADISETDESCKTTPSSPAPSAGRSHPSKGGELDGVPYRLFSVLPLDEQINVATYLKMARDAYDAAIGAGKVAVFVGGTGFYISALINGISPIPETSAENRLRAREMVRLCRESARQLLLNADPDNAFADPQRMARAIEVFLETGQSLTEWQELPRVGAVVPHACKILVNPHKGILEERIARRVPEMMAGGAMAEAHAVIAAKWEKERAIGASELVKFINGEIGETELYENWVRRTVQYAKRQRTWFRTQYAHDIEIAHVPTDEDVNGVL